MDETACGSCEVDLAWIFLRANDEFKKDIYKVYKDPNSEYSDHLTLGTLKLIRYRNENEILKKKWGILNIPNHSDATGHNVFWDPSASTNSVEAKVCKSTGVTLLDIFRLPHIKVTGVVFEHTGKCMIKIMHGFQFYQLVLANFEEADHSKTIQLCIPMTDDFSTKLRIAQSLWGLLKRKKTELDKDQPIKESMLIAQSIEEGASHKEIAQKLFGAESVRKNWAPDSWMRAKTRYSINKTKALIRDGYRQFI